MLKDPAETETFKSEIGWAQVDSIEQDVGILFNWGSLPLALRAEQDHWQVEEGGPLLTRPGVNSRYWVLLAPPKTLVIRVSVSSTGNLAAREMLLHIASLNMMVRIPFKRGPAGLGDMSAQNANKIIWTFKNVCASVEDQRTGVDLEYFARKLEDIIEQHVTTPLSQHIPTLAQIITSANRIHVGQQTELKFVQKLATNNLIVAVERPGLFLEVVSSDAHSVLLKGVAPGSMDVEIKVSDRQTLLGRPERVHIEVVPPNQP